MLRMFVELGGVWGVERGVGRADSGIIIAIGVIDGTFFVATVNAHRKD